VKKLLLLIFLVLLAAIVVNRQRLFVRDPLATVYTNDAKQSGVQVFINYSNDVLLEQDAEPGSYRTLVQAWNKMPGTPLRLICLHWLACLTEADQATLLAPEWSGKGKYDPHVNMTSREVSFVNPDGAHLRIVLR
jgi:hypothetical protein